MDDASLPTSISLSLLPGVKLVDGESAVSLETSPQMYRPRISLPGVTPALRSALSRLQEGPVPPRELIGQVLQAEGTTGLTRWSQVLKRLGLSAMLCYTLEQDQVVHAVLRPLSISFRFSENQVDASRRYALSRFAVMRCAEGRMLLECPLGHGELTLNSPQAAAAVHRLARPHTAPEIASAVAGWDETQVMAFLNLLVNLRAVSALSPEGASPEGTDPALVPWEFHDLLFHTRTRLGRHANPYGGTYPFEGKLPPLPAIKPPVSDQIIRLEKPDLQQVAARDKAFTEVLEQRMSLREHGATPLTREQLAEFLYRVAHVKHLVPEAGVSFRPHPAGGALHELEIYPVVHQCTGLEPGIYHYNPLEHYLCQVAGASPGAKALLQMAGIISGQQIPPQVLLVITARFQRLQHKYQSLAYALTLKNLGALYQTMYLVATAMDLAPCALGGGHADMFAQSTGLEYLAESSVGEFILGSRAPGTPDRTKYERAPH